MRCDAIIIHFASLIHAHIIVVTVTSECNYTPSFQMYYKGLLRSIPSIRRGALHKCRSISTTDLDRSIVHRRGDDHYGSRQYILLPPFVTMAQFKAEPTIAYGSIFAHRNVVFGAQTVHEDMLMACGRLLDVALEDCGSVGGQPQAVASLAGLCKWVVNGLETEDILLQLKKDDIVSFDAVKAVATGVPREGHSVLGVGTYRDAERGWMLVATEFVKKGYCKEANLFISRQGELTDIEHMADKSEAYLRTAGGTMARFFFL